MDFKQASELRYRNTSVQEFATPMVYAKRIEPAGISFIIAQGSHDGLNYYVKNIECRHPTAYVEIPQGHKAYNMDFINNWEYNLIDVHGGVTYQSDGLHCVDPNGEKTIEWRKSRPRIDRNNHYTRVYIYETAPVKRITGYFTLFGTFAVDANEMLSDRCFSVTPQFVRATLYDMEKNGCVPAGDLAKYQGGAKEIYGWTVSPFIKPTRIMPYRLEDFGLKCPPQSWQYVEDPI